MDKEHVLYHFLTDTFSLNPDLILEEIYRVLDYDFENGNLCLLDNTFIDSIQKLTKLTVSLNILKNSNDEVVESWNSYVRQQYLSIHDGKKFNSPFLFLLHMVRDLLLIEKDGVVFKINKINGWRILTKELGEDIFSTALFADTFAKRKIKPSHFQWNYILSSDFTSLNVLIKEKGLAENHFHLYGSSPNVDLSWLLLMNHPWEKKSEFENFKKEFQPQPLKNFRFTENKHSDIYLLVQIAAFIRLKLFERCCCKQSEENIWRINSIINKIRLIQKYDSLLLTNDFRELISAYHMLNYYMVDGERIDYAIQKKLVREDLPYAEISGERHLYYQCFKYIFTLKDKSIDVQVLFYIYLLIKKYFNGIFIQKNDKYGFDNFNKYQNRKFWFISNTVYGKLALKLALDSNLKENYISDFEARINFDKFENHINSIDNIMQRFQNTDLNAKVLQDILPPKDKISDLISSCCDFTDFQNKMTNYYKKNKEKENGFNYFFVLHFIRPKNFDWTYYKKHTDKYMTINNCIYREQKFRQSIKEDAKRLITLRKEKHPSAYRILGVDAASHEVNCRPEVFGQTFRYISQYQDVYSEITQKQLPQLRKTYHVGEDFYDIIDGLRAIDEAIFYLDLRYGDRIGHGVALGLNVKNYYSRERNFIAMPLQNALDNVAWMLYKIQEWDIKISQSDYAYFNDLFQRYFTKVYHNSQDKNSNKCACISDLYSYIEAWKLRGDNPECFMDSDFSKDVISRVIKSLKFDWDRVNFRQIEKFKNIDENVYYIHHRYHFDYELKKRAEEEIIFEITSGYIKIAKQIQLKMRNFIHEKGVSIESNPTSNFMISNLKDYSDVPLFNLFPITEPDENGYTRLNVSVNTDDQGVFYTSLVKEYTLLAGTLRQQVDENGIRKYSDERILEWITRLIENGKRQNFANI